MIGVERTVDLSIVLLAGCLISTGCSGDRLVIDYFGQEAPGNTPVVFAPGVISLAGRYEYGIVYTPDGQTLCFGETNRDWSDFNVYCMDYVDGEWTDATAARFQGDGDAISPRFGPTAETVYFSSSRPSYPPANIWYANLENGQGTDPVRFDNDITSDADEFAPTTIADGTLYFVSLRAGGNGDADGQR